jgi:hypothetical protein
MGEQDRILIIFPHFPMILAIYLFFKEFAMED